MKLKKILRSIHLWIGILSGIIVIILGLTGCVLVFEDEIKPMVYADRMSISAVSGTPLPLQEMMQKAQDIWGKDKPLSALEIQNDAARTWQFRAYQESKNGGLWYWNEKNFYESLFMNPYTGKLILHEQSEFEFFRVILYVHWSLLLNTAYGQSIVGVATLLYVICLLTGLYLWWPKNKKARRGRFSFRWKSTTGPKRKNYDLHSILGFYAFSVGMVIALTGMIWAFPWLDNTLQRLINTGKSPVSIAIPPSPNTLKSGAMDYILTDIKAKYPKAKAYHFYFPKDTSSTVTVMAIYKPVFKSVVTRYNSLSGKLLQINTFEEKDRGEKFSAMNYDIHMGSILGWPGKTLAFLASLISASLPITGFLIWYNKKWGKKKKPAN